MGGLRFAFVLFFASERPILRAVPLFLLKTCFGGLSIPREKSKNFNPFFPHYEHPPLNTNARRRERERERRHTYIFCELSANHKDRLQIGRDERERRRGLLFSNRRREKRERDSFFFLFFRPQEGHVVKSRGKRERERERQLLRLPKHGQKKKRVRNQPAITKKSRARKESSAKRCI
jgi:hypothetical protein